VAIEHPIYASDFIFMADQDADMVNIVFNANTAQSEVRKDDSGAEQAGIAIGVIPVAQIAMSRHTFLRLAKACNNALQSLPGHSGKNIAE
jgi:hypothetical protein